MIEEKVVPSSTTITDLGGGNFSIRTFYSPEDDVPETAWWFDDESVFLSEENGGIMIYENL